MTKEPIKTWTDNSIKNRKPYWWDGKKTDQILKLDYYYIQEFLLINPIDNYIEINSISIGNMSYSKPEFICELCNKGSKKKKYRPACFYPTDIGYYYKCRECEPSKSLYYFLLDRNPDLASQYQWDRWGKKLTGSSYNCPEPDDKKLKREYYSKKERELKERNKRAYEERGS